MTVRTSPWIALCLLAGLSVASDVPGAQEPPSAAPRVTGVPQEPAPQPPQTLPTPRARPTPQPPPATPEVLTPPATPRRPRGRDLNLQIEITISDQAGSAAPEQKFVSMVVADASMGRIRAAADAQRPGPLGMVGTGLNVDARPSVMENDRIHLELTIEYTPYRESGQVVQRPTVLNESLTVILQNGKPLVVSQAADPVTDRKMTVEVRASIMK